VRFLIDLGRSAALVTFAPVFAALFAVGGCDSPPAAADLREWTPQDHDHSDEKERVASGAQAMPAPSGSKEDGNRVLVESTWRSQCFPCHGPVGHGDGPNGPMVKASDLTRADWQSNMTDAQISASITNGKGKMPRFDLPPNVVQGLVARIRASRAR
jgi:cytochrome c oxidase cbb3-type subunit 3